MQLYQRGLKMNYKQIIATLLAFYKLPLREIEHNKWRFWTACDEYRKQSDVKQAIIDFEVFKGLKDA